jgi:hypothetical protein
MRELTSRPYRPDPEKCCEACAFGRGPHAAWCYSEEGYTDDTVAEGIADAYLAPALDMLNKIVEEKMYIQRYGHGFTLPLAALDEDREARALMAARRERSIRESEERLRDFFSLNPSALADAARD